MHSIAGELREVVCAHGTMEILYVCRMSSRIRATEGLRRASIGGSIPRLPLALPLQNSAVRNICSPFHNHKPYIVKAIKA